MDMKKRIGLELRNRSPKEVRRRNRFWVGSRFDPRSGSGGGGGGHHQGRFGAGSSPPTDLRSRDDALLGATRRRIDAGDRIRSDVRGACVGPGGGGPEGENRTGSGTLLGPCLCSV